MDIFKLDYASIKRMYFNIELPDGSKVRIRKANKTTLDMITSLAHKEKEGLPSDELKIEIALNLLNFNVDGRKFSEDDLRYFITQEGNTLEITPIMIAENMIPEYMKWFRKLIESPN